jgi:hypothetical protein
MVFWICGQKGCELPQEHLHQSLLKLKVNSKRQQPRVRDASFQSTPQTQAK